MKRLTIIFVIIIFTKMIIGQICDNMGMQVFVTENGECDYNPWVMVFEDDFDGNTLDLSKWTLPYQGVVRDTIHEHEKQWYANTGNTPSIPINNNIEISNGTIKLIARRETVIGTYVTDWSTNPPTTKTETFDFTSAEIDSKYNYGYGMYEIRCKIPYGKGFFPAYWMYGEGENNINNEIDVFEFWDDNTHDHNMTAHYNGLMCLVDYNGPDYSQAFHTFTVIWDNYKMEWYVDGYGQNNLKRLSPKFWTLLGQTVDCIGVQAGGHYIMDKVFPRDPMQIIANLALQTGTFQPDLSTPFPSSLEIDYIRYYKKINCTNNVNITDILQLDLSNNLYNIVVGSEITLSGNVIIPNGMQLDLVSQETIRLLPGFKAGIGSNIIARIDANICSGLNEFSQNPFENAIIDSLVLMDTNESVLFTDQSVKDFKIKTYPNPNSEKLFIELGGNILENLELILFDVFGKIVYSKKPINESFIEINMNEFGIGVYFLKILNINREIVFIYKIIKSD